MNFFEWIRDGVKQSVLLGVNDAMESIGTPSDSDQLHPNMVALLEGKSDATKAKGKRGSTTARKRLGKSLKEMNES